MRKIKIQRVNSSSGTIEVAGDFRQIFQGKFYRDPNTEDSVPAYTTDVPGGYVLIRATTFDIIENSKYAGRYTVYTPVSSADILSSVYDGQTTSIKVNEVITQLSQDDDTTLESAGYLTNISTYLLNTGTTDVVVPPVTNITRFPVEFIGRDSTGWGEAFNQNFINIARTFSGDQAPVNPFVGQQWYDTTNGQVYTFSGVAWGLMNEKSYGTTHQHTQSEPSAEWTINHHLNLDAPYIAFCEFFVDRGQGAQLIIPSNVVFVSKDQIKVTFSNAEIGYVLVRQ